jgi:AraC-like DNA-binding protein
MQFPDILILSGIICGFVTSIILIITAKNVNNRLIGISFFTLWWQALFYLLTATFLIYKVPYLYRTGAPFYYLIPALNYLYVRNILQKQKNLFRSDYWHFLPFILAVIDLMPYYLSDTSVKLAFVDAVMKDVNNCYLMKTGFLPSYLHFLIRPVQGIIYSVFQIHLIYKAIKAGGIRIIWPGYTWLILLTLFFMILHSGMLVSAVTIYYNQGIGKPFFQLLALPKIYISVTFLCVCLCLFFFPKILYNLNPLEVSDLPEPVSEGLPAKLKVPISDNKLDEYIERIETLMEESQCFTRDLTLNGMADLLDINHRYLSYILNNHYELSFPDFINGYRVRYILKRINAGDFKTLKLEAIANDAGFTSRTTFHNAFKKHIGSNPSQYIKEHVSAT